MICSSFCYSVAFWLCQRECSTLSVNLIKRGISTFKKNPTSEKAYCFETPKKLQLGNIDVLVSNVLILLVILCV